MDKKKATEKISIPLLLDVGEVIASTGVTLPEGAPTAPDGSPVSSLPVLTPVANPGHVLPASARHQPDSWYNRRCRLVLIVCTTSVQTSTWVQAL